MQIKLKLKYSECSHFQYKRNELWQYTDLWAKSTKAIAIKIQFNRKSIAYIFDSIKYEAIDGTGV